MVPISRLGRPLLSWQFGCKVPVRGSKTDQNNIIIFACYISLYNVCISFDFFLKIKTFKTGMRTSLKQRPNREENVKFCQVLLRGILELDLTMCTVDA